MERIKIIFLILSVALPFIFIILSIINIKHVKKSKKSKVRICTAIILLFSINFGIYELIGIKKIDDDKKPTAIDSSVKDNEIKPVNNESSKKEPIFNGTTSTGAKIETENGVTKIDGIIIVNKEYSIREDYIPASTSKIINKNTKSCAECLVEDAFNAFVTMQSDALKSGIKLWIQSGYRSFDYQEKLHKNYIKKDGEEKANLYSASAGHSEHQTGLAIDLNTVNASFANSKEGIWTSKNAYKYGFIIRYPKDKENETGYGYEPWHIRYVGEHLAEILYNNGNWITLEKYFGLNDN